MTIKKIGPISLARITAMTYACLGLLFGAIFSLISMAGMALSSSQHHLGGAALSPIFGVALGMGAVIFFPIIYGIIGFVGGLIGALIYNLMSSWVGGIELEIG